MSRRPRPSSCCAGGTGGAKLARGMLDVVGADLVVIANTGDDVEVHGAHVSPDPDLVTYWLADRIDERGWGLRDDTFGVMDALASSATSVWFRLGDRDLAVGLRREADPERIWIVPPSIDAFSPKNQELGPGGRRILQTAGLGDGRHRLADVSAADGTPGRVNRRATLDEGIR